MREMVSDMHSFMFWSLWFKVVESGVFDLGLSDHSLVYCVLKSGRPVLSGTLLSV